MANNHIITKQIGNLRGFSTDSIFTRPANVADVAINLQRAPDGTTQLRRGYQCQIATIGGLGIGTFDDPTSDDVKTVTIGLDGFLYNKLTKQIFFYYDGIVSGGITGASQANPCKITSVAHGLQTGAIVTIFNVGGMIQLNNKTYTIMVTDVDHFTLNGVDSTAYTAYTSGGTWQITFTDQRFLTFTIFTDPRYLTTNPGWSVQPWSFSPWGAPSGESITCNITVNKAAVANANSSSSNTVSVQFGHELVATDIIQFYTSIGQFQQRNVVSVTATSITFDGFPVSIKNGTSINQFFDIPFRKGFDVSSPYLISTFLSTITAPSTGIYGLEVAWNGDTDLPAAFLQIVEPTIIDSNNEYTIDYWYWDQINATIDPPFPGSANPKWQNSPDFENATFAAFDDVIYIANGQDFPQKYDGQTVYRAGMPKGVRPVEADNTMSTIKPFSMGNAYEYAIAYEQVDNLGHIVLGELSEVKPYTVVAGSAAIDVTVTNLQSSPSQNWNTNCAKTVAGTYNAYGPDANGLYYNLVNVQVAYTLKIGDSGYYLNPTAATITGNVDSFTLIVTAGHVIEVGDLAYFPDAAGTVQYLRQVNAVTSTTFTVSGDAVTVAAATLVAIYKESEVFGDVAIVNGTQINVNAITVLTGHSIQNGDLVDFVDSNGDKQRRTVTATGATSVTVNGIAISINTGVVISSENQRAGAINLQTINTAPIVFPDNSPISNNLRINIYRTLQGQSLEVNGSIYLIASIPNDSLDGSQTYTDLLADNQLIISLAIPGNIEFPPNPPPITKYLKVFGSQMFYAGGQVGNAENSDRTFFSGEGTPEAVDIFRDNFTVPSVDDDISGIGIAGTSLVITKDRSLWAATGDFLSGQIQVVQIAPGSNIGCSAHATIVSVGTLMYFMYSNGVYAITENQIFPTDPFGNPIPLSLPIDALFRETNFLPQTQYVYKRAVATNYTKDNQYLLFLPCENKNSTIRTANTNSLLLCYDYQEKNWYQWYNMNAAGGLFVIKDDLYFQERRFSGVDGNVANLYKQHRFYRLVDHADHAGPQRAEWRSSWEDLGQPEVRKKFCRCILLMDRISSLLQYNNPTMYFSSYLDRIPNLQNTIAQIYQTDNIRNSSWSFSGWGWNFWSGYQDSFVTVNMKGGTVAKSMQVGFAIQGINMDIRLAGFQLEAIPENRKTVVR